MKVKQEKTKTTPRKTIEFSELKRLCFCNSEKIPVHLEIDGNRYNWCGFGLVNEGKADGTETLVVENGEKPRARKKKR